jgi:GTP pyrophosphokinase
MEIQQSTDKNTLDEQVLIDREYQLLIDDYLHSNHRRKVEIIDKAFRFANQAHQGIKRRSGEPYILHPLAVARIVAHEIGLGSTSICASLLHDVVEDTDYTVEDIENLFGKKIASIVDGLTKISGGVFGEKASAQAENFRKLLLTMSEDIRVILIKIADRLHNMRTLGSMPQAKQFKIAGETQYIYAPLANRLGLHAIKTELEDLSFKYEHRDKYDELSKKLDSTQHERDLLFELFSKPITEKLKELGFKFEIHARIKSIYSIWNKMQTKNIPFEEIFDILALRIIFDLEEGKDEKKSCWEIYSAITDIYKPHPDRIRDWISTPKANGYEALHVTVMGPLGQWIEVQIRSRRMDDIAERGFAAHWLYKTDEKKVDYELEKWLQTIKELLENPEPNAIDFLDTFKLNLFASEIFVFTPKGDIRTLPQGATALDFAFSLHTDIGFHCIGAKVNHKLVPLSYVLNSGDQVEVLTSKKQKANPDWINIVKTARAKSKIRSLFKKEYKAFIRKGEYVLQNVLENINLSISTDILNKILEYYQETKKEELYYKIGKGTIKVDDIGKTLFKDKSQNRWIKYWKLQFGKSSTNNSVEKKKNQVARKIDQKEILRLTDDNSGVTYRIADCCNPIPGDDILGFKEMDGMLIVHKRQCPVAMKLKSNFGERIISAVWETHKILSFPATIEIKGIDSMGILSQIIKIISDVHEVNVNKVNLETKDGIFEGLITLYVHDVEDINNLSMNILKIKGVNSVNRVN